MHKYDLRRHWVHNATAASLESQAAFLWCVWADANICIPVCKYLCRLNFTPSALVCPVHGEWVS